MRRLARIFLHTLTAFSTLFLVATVTVWVRSKSAIESHSLAVGRPAMYTVLQFGAADGGFSAAISVIDMPASQQGRFAEVAGPWEPYAYHRTALRPVWNGPPPIFETDTKVRTNVFGVTGATLTRHSLHGALWLATLFFTLLPAWRIVAYVRRRRTVTEGHCRNCGYDLRATPARCPECGHTPLGWAPPTARTKPVERPI